jgi:hypothetical protein
MPGVQIPTGLRPLWDYWRAKRGKREMPERRDIEPAEIPALLPHISLFEVVGDRFQFRIAGRFIVEAYGVEPRGMYLDEVLSKDRADAALKGYRTAKDLRRAVLARSEMTTPRGWSFPLTRLLLPLGSDSSVTHMLAGVIIESSAQATPAPLGRDTTMLDGSMTYLVLEDSA